MKKAMNRWKPFLQMLVIVIVSACGDNNPTPLSHFQHARNGEINSHLSQHGQWLISLNASGQALLWNLPTRALTYLWRQSSEPDSPLILADISFHNKYAVTASQTEFALWNVHSGKNLGYWQVKDTKIRDIALSPTAERLAVALNDGRVLLKDINKNSHLYLEHHSSTVNRISFSPNGQFLLSAGQDHRLVVYHMEQRKKVVSLTLTSPIQFAQFLSPSEFVAASKEQIMHYQITNNQLVPLVLETHSEALFFTDIRQSNDKKWIAASAANRKVLLWRSKDGKLIQSWSVGAKNKRYFDGATVNSLAFTQQNKQQVLVTSSTTGATEYWQLPNE